MKTKKTVIILVLAVIILSLVGCGKDPIQKDLINYVNNELPKIGELENDVMDSYGRVSGANYTDDETMYNAMKNEVIPASIKLIEASEAVNPESEEIRALHKKYLNGINTQNSAFGIILLALETQDAEKITLANEKLTTARTEMSEYLVEIKELAKTHDVELNN